MRISSAVLRFSKAAPWVADALLSAPARGLLPSRILNHWLASEVLRRSVGRSILVKINGKSYYVPAVAAQFYRKFEPSSVAFLNSQLQAGECFVDVGANIGFLTITASRRVGPTGQVHAIEPGRANLKLLHHNLARHRCQNVIVHPLAVGEKSGVVTLRTTTDQLNDSTTVEPFTDIVAVFRVPQERLDALLKPPVDFIKIDVQGGELSVLRSMEGLIRESPRLRVLVEWEPRYLSRAGYMPEDLLDVLSGLGLSPEFVIDDRAGLHRSVSEMLGIFADDPERYGNLLAVRAPTRSTG